MNRIKTWGALRLLFFIFSLPVACKSVPQTPDAVLGETGYIPLEPGAQVYVFADVKNARHILDIIQIPELSAAQSKQMLDRTQSAVIALYPPGSNRRLQLAAWGSYPAFQANLAFGSSKDWKRKRSAAGLPYWYSTQNRLSAALNPKQAFVLSWNNGTPSEPFAAAPGVELPEGFDKFRRNAALACWFENPAPLINKKFKEMNVQMELPAECIFAGLFPTGEQERNPAAESSGRQYEALIRIQAASAVQARALAALFVLARNMLPRETAGGVSLASILFAYPPVPDGKNLNIKTSLLSEKEIALLFTFFSLK